MLAEKLSDRPNLRGEAFNFSNESPVTVGELVEKIIALMGMRLKPQVRNETSNEIRHQTLSAVKARNEFGWRPRFTLDEGLQIAVAWYRETLKVGPPGGIARINDHRLQPSCGMSAFGHNGHFRNLQGTGVETVRCLKIDPLSYCASYLGIPYPYRNDHISSPFDRMTGKKWTPRARARQDPGRIRLLSAADHSQRQCTNLDSRCCRARISASKAVMAWHYLPPTS
jgi:hypothetical protein